jgi:hypothetical protein
MQGRFRHPHDTWMNHDQAVRIRQAPVEAQPKQATPPDADQGGGMTRKFEMVSRTIVEQYAVEMGQILLALGHPEALVTDLSSLGDFDMEPLEYALVEEALGVPILTDNDLLVDIARRIRELSTRRPS